MRQRFVGRVGKSWFGAIVPDGVVGPQANPLGDGTVLLLGLCKLLLGLESLVALFIDDC